MMTTYNENIKTSKSLRSLMSLTVEIILLITYARFCYGTPMGMMGDISVESGVNPDYQMEMDISATCDDNLDLFVDGLHVLKQSQWREVVRIELFKCPHLFAIKCENYIGPGGIIASFGSHLVTDSTHWKCTGTDHPGWDQIGYDDSSWPNAFAIKGLGNTSWPWGTFNSSASLNNHSMWIWTKNYIYPGDDTVYCRGDVTNRCTATGE